MEFKIIKGVRHYRMNSNEPWKVDNLSQAEMERLLRESEKKVTEKPPVSQRSATSRTQKKKGFLERIFR